MRAILTVVALAFVIACGEDPKQFHDAAVKMDAGVDTGGGGPDASCFENPTTHYEIINACTTAQKVYKNSHPALIGSDGTLPPLP
jgi:hypothetical protein